MSKIDIKTEKRRRRHRRIRSKISGTASRPRLAVFKSNRYISVQLIDDDKGCTLASATSKGISGKAGEQAAAIGKLIAEKAKVLSIESVVFDRGGYLYAGAIKKVADGAREGGLRF